MLISISIIIGYFLSQSSWLQEYKILPTTPSLLSKVAKRSAFIIGTFNCFNVEHTFSSILIWSDLKLIFSCNITAKHSFYQHQHNLQWREGEGVGVLLLRRLHQPDVYYLILHSLNLTNHILACLRFLRFDAPQYRSSQSEAPTCSTFSQLNVTILASNHWTWCNSCYAWCLWQISEYACRHGRKLKIGTQKFFRLSKYS